MRIAPLVVCAVLLPVAGAAQPQAAAAGGPLSALYAFVRVGAVVPQHQDLDLYDAGPAFEVGAGYALGSHLAIEAAMGRFSMAGSASWSDPVGGVEKLDVRLSGIPITGTLKLALPMSPLELHALAGVGVHFVSERVDLSRPNLAGGSFSGSDHDTVPGFHVGAGASIAVTPRLLVGADVRYLLASTHTFDAEAGMDSLLMGASLAYRFR